MRTAAVNHDVEMYKNVRHLRFSMPCIETALFEFYNVRMPISARNKLRGKIEEIQLGDVMAHVVVRVGDNLIESAITRRSADELKLKKGDTVTAVVKATEVMIQKD